MYELSGVYDFANANLYGASMGALPPINTTIVNAATGMAEEGRRRAIDQLSATPGSGQPTLASTGNTTMYVGIGAALFLGWFLFLRKK